MFRDYKCLLLLDYQFLLKAHRAGILADKKSFDDDQPHRGGSLKPKCHEVPVMKLIQLLQITAMRMLYNYRLISTRTFRHRMQLQYTVCH